MANGPPRTCQTCIHRFGENCRHPQAIHVWGSLQGMQNALPDKGWPRWPEAKRACGFFRPTSEWLTTAENVSRAETLKIQAPKPRPSPSLIQMFGV